MLLEQIAARLEKRRSKGELRVIEDYKIEIAETTVGKALQHSDRHVDFASNDYLSFATNTEEGERYLHRLKQLGRPALGSTGSRTASGNSIYHVALENRLAKFHNAETALLFNSGYDANSAVWTYLPQPGDVVIYDQLIHASIHEGLKLSRASLKLSFDHNSEPEMRRQLLELTQIEKIRKGEVNVFVAIESLYSMDGDLSPLKDIVETVRNVLSAGNGYIIIDEVREFSDYDLVYNSGADLQLEGTLNWHIWTARTRLRL